MLAPASAVLLAFATPAGAMEQAVPVPVPVPIPIPTEDEVRPVAPARHPWSDRSGALLVGGASAAASLSSSHGLAVVEARAGMHEYGLEWAVGGAVGRSWASADDGGSGLVYEAVLAPGARLPLGGRLAAALRFTAALLSMRAERDGGAVRVVSVAFGGEAGGEVALGRALRLEARLSCRVATGLAADRPTVLAGVGVGVVGIP